MQVTVKRFMIDPRRTTFDFKDEVMVRTVDLPFRWTDLPLKADLRARQAQIKYGAVFSSGAGTAALQKAVGLEVSAAKNQLRIRVSGHRCS
jgi:hypothetical protein